MRLASIVATTSLLSAVLAACGGDEGAGPTQPGTPDAAPPPPTSYANRSTYVFDSITVPETEAQGQLYGLDIDGDGDVDNKLSEVIDNLSGFVDGLAIQGTLDTSIADGSIILLADLRYEVLTSGNGALGLYQGDDPSTPPCADAECGQHLDGTTSFSIATGSPRDNVIDGVLGGGQFLGTDGTFLVPLPLGSTTVTISVIAAKAEVTASTTDLTNGLLGGGITEQELEQNVLPAVATLVTEETAADCQGTAPDCCTPGTNGAQAYQLLDANDDCVITGQELADNALLGLFLQPDLDLLDDTGAFNPGVDGVLDSLSLGIGFSAVGASFDP